MPRDGFYNDNEYRQYPFVFKGVYSGPDLPTVAVVDCGFIMGIDSDFDDSADSVYLASLKKTATALEFEFRTTAPKIAAVPLLFTRELDAAEWAEDYAESAPATAAAFCATEPAWSGFMVSGPLTDVVADMQVGETRVFTAGGQPERVVEPNRIQSLVKAYLRSINVGNYARKVIPACETQSSSSSSAAGATITRQIVVNAGCIKGKILMQPGFNCAITQTDAAGTLTITAALGANTLGVGAQEFCQNGSEIKLHPAEQPPSYSKFLSGGPACDEVITAINGLQTANVKIVGGAGIRVVADTENNNTIQIKLAENLLSKTC
jgi:hypothetical protein